MTYRDPANIHTQLYHAHKCRLGANTPQIGDLDCISILSKSGNYSTNRLSLHRVSRPFSKMVWAKCKQATSWENSLLWDTEENGKQVGATQWFSACTWLGENYLSQKWSLKKKLLHEIWKHFHGRAGEMTPWLGALAALPEDLESVPRTNSWWPLTSFMNFICVIGCMVEGGTQTCTRATCLWFPFL